MLENTICLSDVLLAENRIAGKVANTPFLKSDWLSGLSGAHVYMKLENVQVTGSFKYRGALNALYWARENHISKIFTASAGNHGLGIAEAAVHTELDATICIPIAASPMKRQKLQTYSVGVVQHGDECEITEGYAKRLAGEKKGYYVSPYNNKEVIAGAGTLSLEMLKAIPSLSTIICSVGGGGLISGVAIAAKAINPKIKVIGIVAANTPAMSTAINSGRIVRVYQEKTIADGISGNIDPESITFPLVQEYVDDWVVVEEPDIVATVFEFLDNEGMLIEGAAATAVAAISRKLVTFNPKEKVGVIICGGNISRQEWREILVNHLVGAKKA